MKARYAGTIPLKVKPYNMPGHTCESCKFRNAKYLVEYNPPGNRQVKHELCPQCSPKKPQYK